MLHHVLSSQAVSWGLFTHCGLRFVNYIFLNHRVAITQCGCLLNPLDHPTPFRKPTLLHQTCSSQTHTTPPPTLLKLFVIINKKNCRGYKKSLQLYLVQYAKFFVRITNKFSETLLVSIPRLVET